MSNYTHTPTVGEIISYGVFTAVKGSLWLGAATVLTSLITEGVIADPSHDTMPSRGDTPVVACGVRMVENRLQVPTMTNQKAVIDNRTGNITACDYLADLNMSAGVHEIRGISRETFDHQSSSYEITGKMGGVVLFAVGGFSGEINGSGKSEVERERLVIVNVVGDDGNAHLTVLNAEKNIAVNECDSSDDACKPKIEINATDLPLWYKETGGATGSWLPWISKQVGPDTSSIWSPDGTHANETMDFTRKRVVDQLLKTPDNSYEAKKPGELLVALADNIVITVPTVSEKNG